MDSAGCPTVACGPRQFLLRDLVTNPEPPVSVKSSVDSVPRVCPQCVAAGMPPVLAVAATALLTGALAKRPAIPRL